MRIFSFFCFIVMFLISSSKAFETTDSFFCATKLDSADYTHTMDKRGDGCEIFTTCDLPNIRDSYRVELNDPIKYVQVLFHIVQEDDGSNPSINLQNLQLAVDALNNCFAPWKIQFEYRYQYIYSSAYRTLDGWGEPVIMKGQYAEDFMSQCNTYITSTNMNGYLVSWGEFPFSEEGTTFENGVVLNNTNSVPPVTQDVICHEFGHALGGLYHTHHGVNEVEECGPCYEAPRSFEGDSIGDLCSDTPSNPVSGSCDPDGGVDNCSGIPWAPNNAQTNYMSYGWGCDFHFTSQQMGRFHCYLETVYPDMFHYIRGIPDITFGASPLEVQFTGYSEYPAEDWIWVFNETDTIVSQNPSYLFTTPGDCGYSLHVVTVEGDTLSRHYKDYVKAVADSVRIGSISALPGESVILPVTIESHVELEEIVIPIELNSNDLVLDSISTAGCVGEDFFSSSLINYSSWDNSFTYKFVNYSTPYDVRLPAGVHHLMNIHLTVNDEALPGSSIPVTPKSYASHHLMCYTGTNSYPATGVSGNIEVLDPGCCLEMRGNINNDIDDILDISDLLFFVDYIFGVPIGPEPACETEADVDGSNSIDISDLLYLVDYFFAEPAGPPPINCN